MYYKTEQQIMKKWKGNIDLPVISICCTAYNHENFIEEALHGFLMQETDFPFEILLHDDCSNDNTAEIIREYEQKYPNIIKPIYQIENQYSKGIKPDPTFNFPRSKGKYIARCEGDDYWIDPLKLQKQVMFLEENKEYTACSHNSKIILNNQSIKEFWKNTSMNLRLEDMLSHRKFHTASLLFRTSIIKDNPLPKNILSVDRALYILLASFGPIKYFGESMCIYRKHEGGISSWITVDLLKKDLNIIPWINKINPKFPSARYISFVHETILVYPATIDFNALCKHYVLFVVYSFSFFPKNLKLIFRVTRTLLAKLV